MNRLCSICARGGSKGVPNKNISNMNGLSLLSMSIIQARKSGLFSHIAVSSDSDEILNIAKEAGSVILVKRPDEMATDTAGKLPVIQHCFREAEKITGMRFETGVDLDATSPLRSVDDIIQSVKLLEDHPDADNLVTVMHARRSPYFNLLEMDQAGYVHLSKQLQGTILRRQDSPKCFDMNASIYIWKREKLLNTEKVLLPKTIFYLMPEERSIDIVSPLDYKIVEMLLKDRMHEFK